MLPYKVLKFFDDVTSALVAVLLALLAVYAGYALWDNRQVYAAAEEVQASLLTLKPQEGGTPFAELRAVNADVCAWVTLDGTGVDYPVVQGKDNLTYVNTDVYGNFSLAGTIFLDTRCAPDFAGGYSLLYGHHMVSGQMFGDLEKYQDAAFLREHRTGTLLLPDGACTLEVFALRSSCWCRRRRNTSSGRSTGRRTYRRCWTGPRGRPCAGRRRTDRSGCWPCPPARRRSPTPAP